MINHARTLLLNVDGDGNGYSSEPGAEYIPPDFQAQTLGSLGAVYRILFGSNPDSVFLNYRARQLMNLIHSTDLVDYVLALDSRITYDTTPIDEFFYDLFQVQVAPYSSTAGDLVLIGDLQPENDRGRTFQKWLIEQVAGSEAHEGYFWQYGGVGGDGPADGVFRSTDTAYIPEITEMFIGWKDADLVNRSPFLDTADEGDYLTVTDPEDPSVFAVFVLLSDIAMVPPDGGSVSLELLTGNGTLVTGRTYFLQNGLAVEQRITVSRQTPPRSLKIFGGNYTGGLSELIPLDGSNLQVRVPNGSGAKWSVSGYARPTRSLGDLESALRSLGEPLLIQLFRVTQPEGNQEPYKTFRNCWEHSKEQPYRLAGLLLAYIYRLEALRTTDR